MGEDDDMGEETCRSWQNTGMARERYWSTTRSKTRASMVERVGNGELSKYVHATVRHCGDRLVVSAGLATKHRAAVARVVYLAQDRLDLGVATVELDKNHGNFKRG